MSPRTIGIVWSRRFNVAAALGFQRPTTAVSKLTEMMRLGRVRRFEARSRRPERDVFLAFPGGVSVWGSRETYFVDCWRRLSSTSSLSLESQMYCRLQQLRNRFDLNRDNRTAAQPVAHEEQQPTYALQPGACKPHIEPPKLALMQATCESGFKEAKRTRQS